MVTKNIDILAKNFGRTHENKKHLPVKQMMEFIAEMISPICKPGQFGKFLKGVIMTGIKTSSPNAMAKVERFNRTIRDKSVPIWMLTIQISM